MAAKQREPRWLSVEAVRALHAEQIEVFGGEAGLLNPGSLEAALARPQNAFLYEGTTDIAGLAAIYVVGLVRARAFVDGNKRVGLATALVFLALNGQPLHVPPVDLYDLTMRVAMGRAREAWVTAWLRKRMGARRRSQARRRVRTYRTAIARPSARASPRYASATRLRSVRS